MLPLLYIFIGASINVLAFIISQMEYTIDSKRRMILFLIPFAPLIYFTIIGLIKMYETFTKLKW